MKTIGAFQAKTRFGALLEDAIAGSTTIITKNGKPVAAVSPYREEETERGSAVERIRALRKRMKLHGIDPRELINEGRNL